MTLLQVNTVSKNIMREEYVLSKDNRNTIQKVISGELTLLDLAIDDYDCYDWTKDNKLKKNNNNIVSVWADNRIDELTKISNRAIFLQKYCNCFSSIYELEIKNQDLFIYNNNDGYNNQFLNEYPEKDNEELIFFGHKNPVLLLTTFIDMVKRNIADLSILMEIKTFDKILFKEYQKKNDTIFVQPKEDDLTQKTNKTSRKNVKKDVPYTSIGRIINLMQKVKILPEKSGRYWAEIMQQETGTNASLRTDITNEKLISDAENDILVSKLNEMIEIIKRLR